MKLKVVQGGIYPGNAKVIARRARGENVPDAECRWTEVEPGQMLESEELDPRIVRSLRANGIVEEVGDGQV